MDVFDGMDKHFEMAGVDPTDVSVLPSSATGEGNEEAQGANTEGSQTETAASSPDTIQGGSGKDSISNNADGGKKQEPKPQGQSAGDPELKPGDIRLPDGSIVRAGAERRHYESARMFKQENVVLKNDLNTANQKYNTLQEKYNTLTETVKQIGLEDPQQVSSAVRLYKDLTHDPVGTLTKLLAEAKQLGHNIDGIGGSVDAAVLAEINRKLETSATGANDQPQFDQAAFDREVAEEVQDLLQNFPDALTHEDMIASVVEEAAAKGQPISLRQAYFGLRQSAIKNGLDWSQPLGPQIEARKQQTQQQQEQPAPRHPGRGPIVQTQTEEITPFNKPNQRDDTDSIILAAMAENGLNYKR